MMEQVENVQEKAQSVFEPVVEFGRKGLHFGLGAVGMVGDSFVSVYHKSGEYTEKLIERGEKLSADTRERVSKLAEDRQNVAKDTVKKAGDTFDKYSEQVLTRAHIPTSEDIDSVTKKVASLERKLDKAIKETATEPKTTVPA